MVSDQPTGPREDDVTHPGTPRDVPDADRAEQEALVNPPDVELASEATAPGEDVPEADSLEQQLAARPSGSGHPLEPVGDREADAADVLDQEAEVPGLDPDDDDL
jgi:hypothetical protein